MRWPLLWCAALLAFPLYAADGQHYGAIEYARIGPISLRLDLDVPRTASPPPLIIHIHGGDWMFGSRRVNRPLFLLDRGFAIANIDYRLAPRSRFPAQIRDCRDALLFLYQNAAKYGFDGSRIGVMGESAGGHLAMLLALAANEKAFDGSRQAKEFPEIGAVVSLSGPMDIEALGSMGDMLEDTIGQHPVQQLLGGRVKEKQTLAQLASPIRHISPGSPPTLLIYGEQDIVVPSFQALQMQEALQDAGVPVETLPIRGMGHDIPEILQTDVTIHIARFFENCLIHRKPPATRPTRKAATSSDEPFLTR